MDNKNKVNQGDCDKMADERGDKMVVGYRL
jgi:hypothetical protein